MNTRKILFAALAAAMTLSATAQEASKPSVELHGFIRNFYAYDTRESVAGTEDFFYYLPKDESLNAYGDDLNSSSSFRFAALTSRLWVEVKGYEFNGIKMGARVEGDFYNGVSGVTGTANFRLRQGFVTLGWKNNALKLGQAWHPMAVDMPDVFSLNTGSPFGPFSRTPQATYDRKLNDNLSLTGSFVWQMQYSSCGPEGTSANYIKYGCTPELYLGVNYQKDGLLARLGVDVLSIKPRKTGTIFDSSLGSQVNVKVGDRITTVSPFAYVQYKKGDFSVKAKTILAQDGSHLNLNGGYGIKDFDAETGEYTYTPTVNSSTWVSLCKAAGQNKYILFGGYVRNFGTKDALYEGVTNTIPAALYFYKNSFSNMNRMWRLTPTFIHSIGKLDLGLECELTSVQYGDKNVCNLEKGLYDQDLHWITNTRVQALVKFTF